MASDNKVLDMVQEILNCSICMEEAEDPRALQCQHTYCFKCLQKYANTKDVKVEIICPLCSKHCSLPNGKVEELPTSFLYNQLKDANRRAAAVAGGIEEIASEKRPEIMCSSADCNKPAVSYCEMCRYVCTECKDDHQTVRAMKSHVIQTLQQAAEIQKNSLPACPKHATKCLELYCETCSLPICAMCYPVYHASHTCVELTTKADAAEKELGQMIGTIKNHLGKSDQMMQSTGRHLIKLRDSAECMKDKVNKRADEIHNEITRRQDMIIQNVDKHYKQAGKIVQGESDKVNVVKMSLKSLQFCSNQLYAYGRPCDYVTKLKPITDRLKENNPADLQLDLQDFDSTESEKKLHDFKLYEELHRLVLNTCLELKHHTEEVKFHDVKQQKSQEELEDNLRDSRLALEKTKAECEDMKNDYKKTVRDLSFKLRWMEHDFEDLKVQREKANKLAGDLREEINKLLPQPLNGTWESGTRADGNIFITCVFPAGTQMAMHPNPGEPYNSCRLTCWTKKSAECLETVCLIQKAFEARLLFNITSHQLAWHGAVVYRSGFIDMTRTRQRLAALGIKKTE